MTFTTGCDISDKPTPVPIYIRMQGEWVLDMNVHSYAVTSLYGCYHWRFNEDNTFSVWVDRAPKDDGEGNMVPSLSSDLSGGWIYDSSGGVVSFSVSAYHGSLISLPTPSMSFQHGAMYMNGVRYIRPSEANWAWAPYIYDREIIPTISTQVSSNRLQPLRYDELFTLNVIPRWRGNMCKVTDCYILRTQNDIPVDTISLISSAQVDSAGVITARTAIPKLDNGDRSYIANTLYVVTESEGPKWWDMDGKSVKETSICSLNLNVEMK